MFDYIIKNLSRDLPIKTLTIIFPLILQVPTTHAVSIDANCSDDRKKIEITAYLDEKPSKQIELHFYGLRDDGKSSQVRKTVYSGGEKKHKVTFTSNGNYIFTGAEVTFYLDETVSPKELCPYD